MAISSFSILPGCCVLCRTRTGRELDLCEACELDLPWLSQTCPYCSLPVRKAATTCRDCELQPPPFSTVISAFEYRFPVSRMIHCFKENRGLAEGRVLTELLFRRQQKLRQLTETDDTVLLAPVPAYPATRRRRGFNQAEEIARTLAARLGLSVHDSLLRRHEQRPAQKQLTRQQRASNLRGVFSCVADLRGRRILLVDDVITTTATLREISRVLIQAGADDVIGIALARTPRENDGTA
jgi:ComF family protein